MSQASLLIAFHFELHLKQSVMAISWAITRIYGCISSSGYLSSRIVDGWQIEPIENQAIYFAFL